MGRAVVGAFRGLLEDLAEPGEDVFLHPAPDDTLLVGGYCSLVLNNVVLLGGGLLKVPTEGSEWSCFGCPFV